MAKIRLKQKGAQLRGRFAGLLFQVRYGKQYMYTIIYPNPYETPKDTPRERKEKIRRNWVVMHAVEHIQRHYYEQNKANGDIAATQEQINKYETYRAFVSRYYDQWHKFTTSHGKLAGGLAHYYITREIPDFVASKMK